MTNNIHQHRITHSASNPTGSTITNTTTTTNTTNAMNSTNSTTITNSTNLTSTNTNAGSNTADNATNAEDSAVFEISEADFLARVAAFERNEQREAKRANALMERFLARERARDQSTTSARKSQPPPPSSAVPAVSASPVSSVYCNPSGSIPNAAARPPIAYSPYMNGVSPTSAVNTPAYEVPPGLVDITNTNGNDRAYRPNRQRSSNGSSIVPPNNVNTSTLTSTTLSTAKRGLPIIQPDSGTVVTVQLPATATQSIGERDPTTTRESRESKKSKKHHDQDRDQDDKRDVKQKLANRTNGVNGSNQNELNQARAVACSGPRQFSSPIQGIVESSRKLQLHKVSIVSGKQNKDDKENKENMHVLRVYQHRPPAIRLDSMGNMLSPTDPASPTTPTTPNERRTESQLSHGSQPKLGHTPARLSSQSTLSNEKTTRQLEGVESEAKVKKGLRTSFDVCSTLGLSRKSTATTATPAAAKAYSESARDVHPINRVNRTNGTDRNGDHGKGSLRIGGSGSEEDSDEDEVYAHPHLHSHLHLRGGVHPPLAQRLSQPRCKAQSQSGSLTSKDLTRIFTRAQAHVHAHEQTQYDQYGLVKSKYPEFDIPSYNRTATATPHVHRISRSVLASSQRVNIPLRA